MGILMLPTMLIVAMFFGLGLDTGLWYYDHRWAQTQADAAAASAIVFLPADPNDFQRIADAYEAANSWLTRNGSDRAVDNTCPRSDGRNGVSVYSDWPNPADTRLNTVRVCVRRQRDSLFAQLSGVSGVYVSAQAAAQVVDEPSPYSLMAMNETAADTLRVHGPAVWINGGGGTYTRSRLRVEDCEGALNSTGVNEVVRVDVVECAANVDPRPIQGSILEDPFEDLMQPVAIGSCQLTMLGSNITSTPPSPLSPGRYCYQLRITSPSGGPNSTVRLNPGLYVLEQGLQLGPRSTLTGDANDNGMLDPSEQVLLYSTCQAPPVPCNVSGSTVRIAGGIDFLAGSIVQLAGLGTMSNMVIWVDRTSGWNSANPLGSQVQITGESDTILNGRIYAYTSHVEMEGEMTVNMSIVADNIKFSGNDPINVSYSATLAPPLRIRGIIE